jgi:5-(aminomethyl)-3-furanmethanol phosphate kinase
MTITVIKLGGSLSADVRLKQWLNVLAESKSVVIVPGGGPYADMVRQQQARWNFSDDLAHRMAVLAMDQFAIQLHGIESRLSLVNDLAALKQTLEDRQTAIWLPSAMVLSAEEIPASWDVTSDSLAAWLARNLGADNLVIVKSCDIPPESTIAQLIDQDIVDRGFSVMSKGAARNIQFVSVRDFQRVAESLHKV